VAAELSRAVVGGLIVEPVFVSLVAEPYAVFADVVSVADVAGPRACVDIPAPFDALVPVSAVVVGVDSSGHPKFFAFPNAGLYASSSSPVAVAC
jgi:hypothetical protein